MRVKLLATGVLVVGMAVSALAQKQITLLASLSDPTGAKIESLEPKDVSVKEDGKDLTVLRVEPVDTAPKVQILIDNGVGMPAESLSDLRTGVRNLLMAIPEGVEVTFVTTAPQPRFLEKATTDRAKLLAAVDRLAPDSGAGRFVESLYEATQRIDKDKSGRYTIVTVGTSSGDTDVRDSDVNDVMKRVQQRATTVHVVLLTTVNRSAGNGAIQSDLGQNAAKVSGGRFEKIAVANRLTSLLGEIGGELSKTLGGATRQFRITVERSGGNIGGVSLGVPGKVVSKVTLEPSSK